MSDTHLVDRNRVLRVVDSESFATAQYKASGEIDRAKTDYLTITGNADNTDPGIQIAAANDNASNVDLVISPKGSGTVTITGGAYVTDEAGGTVATFTGLSGVESSGTGIVNKTVVTAASMAVDITDTGANGAHGSQLLYTFPAGHIKILGCVANLAVTCGTAGLTATATYEIGVGSAAAGVDNAALTTTEDDIFTGVASDLVSSATTIQGADSTDLTLDGTSTAAKAYLNVVFAADDASDDDTATFTGTVTIHWINLGDY